MAVHIEDDLDEQGKNIWNAAVQRCASMLRVSYFDCDYLPNATQATHDRLQADRLIRSLLK